MVSTTSDEYASCFGFTEEEVFRATDEFDMTNKEKVKHWYDGFTIGELRNIYNPCSVTNFLNEERLKPYWANTNSNGLVSRLPESKPRNQDAVLDSAAGRLHKMGD